MNTTSVEGRIVMVTGGAGGIGAELVAAFAAEGASVISVDLPSQTSAGEQVAAAASTAGTGRVLFTSADITDSDSMNAAVAAAEAEFGGLDVLINNAAVYRTLSGRAPFGKVAPDEFDLVMKVNVRGTWQAISSAVPALRRRGGGSIVNFSSTTAHMGIVGFPHYVASKAAVEGMTRSAAREFGIDRITVNAVAPGLVTDESTRIHNDQSYIDRSASTRSIQREMLPEDLFGTLRWLATPASAFVSGQVIIVDGGQTFA
jgi:NAD(P)-dependent dehydrogenase (short-subunit alcohol dehydrogenase family)